MKLRMNADVSLKTKESGYNGWRKINQYLVWAKEFTNSTPLVEVLEMFPQGVLRIRSDRPYLLHRVPAGVPLHIEGLFGFWHTSDADRIWIHAQYPESHHYTLISGGNFGVNRKNKISWFCPKCANELIHFEENSDDESTDFWSKSMMYVQKFNESEKMRTCTTCNHIHPLAYPFIDFEKEDHSKIVRW